MSDTQRNVKVAREQSLANLVEHARRLQLNSVATFENAMDDDVEEEERFTTKVPPLIEPNKKQRSNTFGSPNGSFSGGQRSVVGTARKVRRTEKEPVPPPPSPREYFTINDLMDEFNATDKLVDQMLVDANILNEDIANCSLHQRDVSLVQQIELETNTRSFDKIFGALSAECDRSELKETIERCGSALERSKEPTDDYVDYSKLIPDTLFKSQIKTSLLNFNSLDEEDMAEVADGTDMIDKMGVMNLMTDSNKSSSPTKIKRISNLLPKAEQIAK